MVMLSHEGMILGSGPQQTSSSSGQDMSAADYSQNPF